MNTVKSSTDAITDLGFIATVMLLLSLFLLSIVALDGSLAPIFLFFLMLVFGTTLIVVFSNKDEIFLKIKLFIFSFSIILIYTLANHYILVQSFPITSSFLYPDGPTFYLFSNLALPYINGEKNFFDLFSVASFPMNELPLHLIFSAYIAYFSNVIDGNNTIIIQKLLSPFFGGMFSVVLYSTLKYQFKDTSFAFKATLAYTLLSAVFIYATSLMRDIDIALAYMIFIYLFLQPHSKINFLFLIVVSYLTLYLRAESGIVLFGMILVYSWLYVRKLQSRSIKLIFYILFIALFSIVILLMYNKIAGMIIDRNESNLVRAVAQSSSGSIGILLNKLPFPLNSVAKVLFGQIQPFPFLLAIDRPPEAISGIFWPFIFMTMLFVVIKKNIRIFLDEKLKYLLMMSITVLFLMSSEPMARRMMSVYPIIYITSLYVFTFFEKNTIKKAMLYYIFGIVSLNIIYYLIKI